MIQRPDYLPKGKNKSTFSLRRRSEYIGKHKIVNVFFLFLFFFFCCVWIVVLLRTDLVFDVKGHDYSLSLDCNPLL